MELNGKSTASPVTAEPMKTTTKTGFRKAASQILAVMVKNVLLVVYGMTVGYPTLLIPALSGQDKEEEFYLNEEQISWISSINMICVPLGCFFSGVITQSFGRRRTMRTVILPFVMCWLLFRYSNAAWQIYLALAMTGLLGGLLEAPVLSYVAEVTQPYLRGALGATSTLSIVVGVLLQFLLGSFLSWRNVALVSCLIPLLAFGFLLLIPESPHWLIMKNRYEDAQRSLAWLRGWTTVDDVQKEFEELRDHYHKKSVGISDRKTNLEEIPTKASFLKARVENAKHFMKKSFLWPLAMVSFLYFLLHFTGASTLQTYAVKLFTVLKTPIDKYYATVLLGAAELSGCILCVFMVKRLGKRITAFISITGTGLCSVITATYAQVTDIKYFNNSTQNGTNVLSDPFSEQYVWIPLVSLILLAFISHCGVRVLPWILIGEIYSKDTRATGCGISAAMYYIFSFSANKIFLKMVAAMTLPGVYFFYGALSLLGIIILHFILPETEGKTLQEICDHFAGVAKLDNKVRRKKKSKPRQGFDNAAFDERRSEINRNEDFESKL